MPPIPRTRLHRHGNPQGAVSGQTATPHSERSDPARPRQETSRLAADDPHDPERHATMQVPLFHCRADRHAAEDEKDVRVDEPLPP
jgi:hypothetical protein